MLSRIERQRRLIYLVIALAPIVVSFVSNQRFRFPWLHGCPLWEYTGVPCPAWGLTRSFMALARGDWHQAMTYHLFGPVLFASFLGFAVHVLVELIRDRKLQTFYVSLVQSPKLQILAFLVILGYHGTRLYALERSGDLYISFARSPLMQWLY